jgi:hypothetical protein
MAKTELIRRVRRLKACIKCIFGNQAIATDVWKNVFLIAGEERGNFMTYLKHQDQKKEKKKQISA